MTDEELRLYALLIAERIEGSNAPSSRVLLMAERIYKFLIGGSLAAQH